MARVQPSGCWCALLPWPTLHLLLQTSVAGLIGVLEDGAAGTRELQGTWHDYKREVVPW